MGTRRCIILRIEANRITLEIIVTGGGDLYQLNHQGKSPYMLFDDEEGRLWRTQLATINTV